MAYATAQQLIDRIGEGAAILLVDDDDSGELSTAETALITRYCEEASRVIDRSLQSYVTVPVTGAVPDSLEDWCLAIAAEQLYSRHGEVPSAVKAMADFARKDLERVASGEMRVDGLTYPGDGFTTERYGMGRPVVANPGKPLRRFR